MRKTILTLLAILPTTAGGSDWRNYQSTAGTEVRAEVQGISENGELLLKTMDKTISVPIGALTPESQREAMLSLRQRFQPDADAEAEAVAESKPKPKPVAKLDPDASPEQQLGTALVGMRNYLASCYFKRLKTAHKLVMDIEQPDARVLALRHLERVAKEVERNDPNAANVTASRLGGLLHGPEGDAAVSDLRGCLDVMHSFRSLFYTADPAILVGNVKFDGGGDRYVKGIDRQAKHFEKLPGASERLQLIRKAIVKVSEAYEAARVDK